MSARIAIVDYGMGNIRSVQNALVRCGASAQLTSDADVLASADALILPGVGAFGEAMTNLRQRGLIEPIKRLAGEQGKPLLGICLGMQLLAEESEERGSFAGLGLIDGVIRRIPTPGGLRLPHMGWNTVTIRQADPLFQGTQDGDTFYFVHSFHMECPHGVIAAVTDYGGDVVAAVQRGNIFGAQFHPERSQSNGLRVLANFVAHVDAQIKPEIR